MGSNQTNKKVKYLSLGLVSLLVIAGLIYGVSMLGGGNNTGAFTDNIDVKSLNNGIINTKYGEVLIYDALDFDNYDFNSALTKEGKFKGKNPITLPDDLGTLAKTKEDLTLTDEMLNNEMNTIVSNFAQLKAYEDKEHTVQKTDDIVTIDYNTRFGTDDAGNTLYVKELNVKDMDVQMGKGYTFEGIENSLVGHKVGDKFKFSVTLDDTGEMLVHLVKDLNDPDEQGQEVDINNKEVEMEVEIKAINYLEMPELNDQFVKDNLNMPGIDTVDKFKNSLKQTIEMNMRLAEADNHIINNILPKISINGDMSKEATDFANYMLFGNDYIMASQYMSAGVISSIDDYAYTLYQKSFADYMRDNADAVAETAAYYLVYEELYDKALAEGYPDINNEEVYVEYLSKALGIPSDTEEFKQIRTELGDRYGKFNSKMMVVSEWLMDNAIGINDKVQEESIDNADNIDNVDNADNVELEGNADNADNTDSAENVESVELEGNVDNADNADNAENVESTETTEGTDD